MFTSQSNFWYYRTDTVAANFNTETYVDVMMLLSTSTTDYIAVVANPVKTDYVAADVNKYWYCWW